MKPPEMSLHNAARIQRFSRWLALLCLVLIVVLPVTLLFYWALEPPEGLAEQGQLGIGAIKAPIETWQRVAGAALSLLPVGMLIAGLLQARRCFLLFAAGRVFVSEATLCLRRFAGWVAASVAAGMLASTALSVVLTINNPPGMRQLIVGVGSNEVFTLSFAAMVWLMAAVIAHGQALAEENASFV